MNKTLDTTFGNSSERIFVALISMATGIILIYLAVEGPLFLHHIRYKTADIVNNQLAGQDLVNMFLLSPILIGDGIALIFKKQLSQYLLIITPLYLIYFVLSYTIGWEWSSQSTLKIVSYILIIFSLFSLLL